MILLEDPGLNETSLFDFEWEITKFTDSTIYIQIDFRNPSMISTNQEFD